MEENKKITFNDLQRRYYYRPDLFIDECFPWGNEKSFLRGKSPCKWQKREAMKIAEKFKADPTINVKVGISSGRGIGKTAWVAMIKLWWVFTRYDANIWLLANNEKQLYTVCWREFSKWFGVFKYKKFFVLNSKSFYHEKRPNTWGISPRTFDEKNMAGIAGQHGGDGKQMTIMDEAAGIPTAVYEYIEGGFTEEGGLLICISNPNKNGTGWFYDLFSNPDKNDDWMLVEIDARDVEITNKPDLEKKIKKYGIDSDYVKIHILGKQVDIREDVFFPNTLITDCMRSDLKEPSDNVPLVAGIDIGKSSDPTELRLRRGLYIYDEGFKIEDEVVKNDLYKQASEIARYLKEVQPDYVVVDAIGMGESMKSLLRHNGITNVYEYNNRCSYDKALFKNKRAEIYKRMKEAMLEGLRLPNDSNLREELRAIKTVDNELLQIISKKDIRKLLKGESPNIADAIALTFLEDFSRKSFKNFLTKRRPGGRVRRIDNFNPLRR